MKLEISHGLIKGLPLAILLAILLHGSAGVWWASGKAKDMEHIGERIVYLETGNARAGASLAQIAERLARIEERLNAQYALLLRLEKQVAQSSR